MQVITALGSSMDVSKIGVVLFSVGMFFALLAMLCAGANLLYFLFPDRKRSIKDEVTATIVPFSIILQPKGSGTKRLNAARTRAKQFIIFTLMAVIFVVGGMLLKGNLVVV